MLRRPIIDITQFGKRSRVIVVYCIFKYIYDIYTRKFANPVESVDSIETR